jgi:hypothetical protein
MHACTLARMHAARTHTRTHATTHMVERARAGTLTNDVVKLKSTLDTTHMHHKNVASEVP